MTNLCFFFSHSVEQLNLAYDGKETENIYQNTELLGKDNILMYLEKNKMEEEPFASEFSVRKPFKHRHYSSS